MYLRFTRKDSTTSKQSININTKEECINNRNCNGVPFKISNNNKEKEHAFGLSMNAATTNYSFINKMLGWQKILAVDKQIDTV